MAMVYVDGSSLPVDSQAKSVSLVWGLVAIWHSVSIHQMNRVNSRSGLAMMTGIDSTVNIVIGISTIATTHSELREVLFLVPSVTTVR